MQTTRVCGFFPSPRALRLSSTTGWSRLASFHLVFLCLMVLNLAAPEIACAQQDTLPAAPSAQPSFAFEKATGFAPAASTVTASSTADISADIFQDQTSQQPQQPTSDAQPPVSERIKIESPSIHAIRHVPGSEIGVYGMYSYGNWEIFAAGIHEHLYTAGFEYYRHTWGYFAGAQMDYAAEFLPVVLLRQPRILNDYGVRRSKPGDDVIVPGLAFSPIGLRMEWRHTKTFKPYFNVMGGAIGFTQKALSPAASYYDFTLHESLGFYYKMTDRVDMRVALFGDFHFSNAYITDYNPGLDVMNSQVGLSYHFGKDDPEP